MYFKFNYLLYILTRYKIKKYYKKIRNMFTFYNFISLIIRKEYIWVVTKLLTYMKGNQK